MVPLLPWEVTASAPQVDGHLSFCPHMNVQTLCANLGELWVWLWCLVMARAGGDSHIRG